MTPFTAVAGIPHAATSAIAYHFGLDARLITVSNGCASSLDAVATAYDLVRNGLTEIAVAGGAEGSVARYVIEIMLKCKRCCTQSGSPESVSRPFDRDRDRGVMAEGAAVVIVENLETALGRKQTGSAEPQWWMGVPAEKGQKPSPE